MADPDVEAIFSEAQDKAAKTARTITSKDMGSTGKPQRLNWAEERARALVENPNAVPNVIRKVYEMAEAGNMDAIKVCLDRDFGKVTIPIEADHTGVIKVVFENADGATD